MGSKEQVNSREFFAGNKTMKSDVGRRGCAFVSRMTFLFDILNIKLKWKT